MVIPYDAAGIAYQAFVSSKTNDVIQLETDEDIQLFIKGRITEIEKTAEVVEIKEDTIKTIKEKLMEINVLIKKLEKEENLLLPFSLFLNWYLFSCH